jgi:hypothetical protein
MKKNKGVRLAADKEGNIEVTFTLPAEAIAKADEMAGRLGSNRNEVLKSFFAALLPSLCDGINDHCTED